MKIEIFSDIACPWCYIGEVRFERALAAFPGRAAVEVVYRPYQLDPSAPAQAIPLKENLARKFGAGRDSALQRVSDAAEGEGIVFDWDRALAVNTREAHRLMRLARTEYDADVQQSLLHRLFEGYFTQGADVASHEQLTGMAVQAGMDATRVREYLASDDGNDELSEELEYARQLGITAVPTFVFNGQYAVQGGQPASVFLQALEEVQRRTTAEPTADAGACGDDGCEL